VKFIVVARLTRPGQSLLCGEIRWLATDLDGTEVAGLGLFQTLTCPPPRASSRFAKSLNQQH